LPTAILNPSKAEAAPGTGFAQTPKQGMAEIGLSPRQVDVLACLLRGMSNKHICRELGLAEGTVKSHTVAIFRALNVTSRAQAVIEASRRGFPVGGQRS
jgi:DNA-binding NarL/FixJ family response regulator